MKSTRPILLVLMLFTITLAATPQAKAFTIAEKPKFCYRYDTTTLQPIGIGKTVFNYTEKVGFWVKINEPPIGADIRVVWTDPSDKQFSSKVVTVVPKTGENWGIVFDYINITESTDMNKLGADALDIWTVSLYIDHVEEATDWFQIINYNLINEKINDAVSQINIIRSENNLLNSQNQQLTLQLQQLQTDYATLQSQIGTSSNYQKLQNDYDDLYDDYEDLGRDLGTTRMMMYAAVVVAVASVGVAVYFGAIKKS